MSVRGSGVEKHMKYQSLNSSKLNLNLKMFLQLFEFVKLEEKPKFKGGREVSCCSVGLCALQHRRDGVVDAT